MAEPLSPEPSGSPEYNRGWADGNASALDACAPVIERLQGERDAVRRASDAQVAALLGAAQDVLTLIDEATRSDDDTATLYDELDEEALAIVSRLRAALAAAPALQPATPPLDGLREDVETFGRLLEAEWYNGNVDEPAYNRLNADLTGILAKHRHP